MIRVITVEREYGSQGAAFAHHLAHYLQWKLIDQCLVDEIAEKAGITKKLAESCDERLDPWYYRFGKTFWHGSIERLPATPDPEFFDAERMVEFVRDYLQQQVKTGHCVIVGRGSTSALLTTPGVFHVFVHASMKRKVEWFQQNFPDHAKDAEQEILETDRRRAAYVRRFYNRDWTDYRLYHLMLNSCMGFEAMVKATVEAAGLTSIVPQHANL
jgi:cytidylate kinase